MKQREKCSGRGFDSRPVHHKEIQVSPREEELYWRGTNFPGTLSRSEFEEWMRIVNAYEKNPTEKEQIFWGNVTFVFALVMVFIAVFL